MFTGGTPLQLSPIYMAFTRVHSWYASATFTYGYDFHLCSPVFVASMYTVGVVTSICTVVLAAGEGPVLLLLTVSLS